MAQLKKPGRGTVSAGAIVLLILLVLSRHDKVNRGLMGIGALIIFIAIVLISAIAAFVLISTGGNLQQKALITGNEAREGVGSGVETVKITGSDASSSGTPHAVTSLNVMVRLQAGSDPLSLNNTVVTLDTPLASQNFLYNGTVPQSATASGTSTFVVSYVKEAPIHEDGYMNRGDVAELKFNINGQLGENIRSRITLIPRTGAMTQLEFMTPDSMVEQRVLLWPTT